MDWKPLLGLVFMLFALGFVGWKLVQYFRHGWKDQFWIWRKANRAAMFIVLIIGFQAVGFAIRDGIGDKVMVYAAVGVIGAALPYLAYICGRIAGIRHRARHGVILS